MTQLVWSAAGQRFFEAGVDHGVLYVDGSDGVAWNGLLSVTESPSGGEAQSFYVDGIKYLARPNPEEFELTIEAYTYPDEFLGCDGIALVKNGLFATQQKKKSFGLCYRTAIGNDVDGVDHAYKLHLIYNGFASPSERAHASMSNSVEPYNFSWKVLVKPPDVAGVKPTASFVIDSREIPADLLQTMLGILYGTSTTPPRLPSVGELFYLFNEYEATGFDAGHLTETYYNGFDAGHVGDVYTSTIDGGTP